MVDWKGQYFLNQTGWKSVCGSRSIITVALTFEEKTCMMNCVLLHPKNNVVYRSGNNKERPKPLV